MKLETVTIDIGGGDTATAYKDVLRITARLHEAELRKYMLTVKSSDDDGLVALSELEKMETAPKPDVMVDLSSIDNDAINEVFILNQVTEWTLGPVDKETLDRKMTREQYKRLVSALDEMYKPVPLAEGAS